MRQGLGQWLSCLHLMLLVVCLGNAAAFAQAVPSGGWSEVTVQLPQPDKGGRILLHRGAQQLGALSFPQAERLGLTRVSVEDGVLVVDARETLKDGGKLTLNLNGVNAEQWRGQIVEASVTAQGKNGALLHLYLEGRSGSRPHYYALQKQRLRGERKTTMRFRHELPEDLQSVHIRLDMLTAGIYRIYGGVVRLAPDLPPIQTVEKPELLFHASFDGTAEATVARGSGKPVVAQHLSYGDGIRGQALRMTRGTEADLAYALKDNVLPERGTVMLWYKPEWEFEQRPFDHMLWRNLFGFERIEPRVGSGAIWLWCWDTALRGDTADIDDNYIQRANCLQPGTWHHVAFAWDERGGRLYCDGRGSSSRFSDSWSPMVEALKGTDRLMYDRENFQRFFVGSMRGQEQADGLIDELRIYSAPLSEEAIRLAAAERHPFAVTTSRRYFAEGEPLSLTCRVIAQSGKAQTVTWSVVDSRGERVASSAGALAVSGQDGATLAVSGAALAPGRYDLVLTAGDGREQRQELWYFRRHNPELSQAGELRLELLETIKLDGTLPQERFRAVGKTWVRELQGVKYVETSPEAGSRFAVRVNLPGEGHLYCFEFDYPDDRARTADILVQSCGNRGNEYELQTGYACGDEYPSQQKIVTSQCLYWSRDKDVAVVVMTPRAGAPAAMSGIRVYRVVDGLPAVQVREAPLVDGWRRSVAMYFEDPAINYDFAVYGKNMPALETMIDRIVAKMKYTGENLLAYPGVWYQGLIGDIYNPRNHAPEFLEAFYTKFDREGLMLMPTFNQNNQQVPEGMVTLKSMKDGSLHSSPCTIWDTGRPNPGKWHDNPPNFNISHPSVQEGILKDFERMLAQGAPHPSFKGFVLHLTRHCLHWFGDIQAGYNDYTIEMFEQATGIRVPVDRSSPLRGKLYAEWLLEHCREEWIAWRCRFLADWYKRLARRLAEVRPDLRLVLNSFSPVSQKYADFLDPAIVERRNREAGLDARLFADTPNIVICQTIVPADYRFRRRTAYPSPEIEQRQRTLDDVRETYDSLRGVRLPWVNQHDRYWESAVGRTKQSLTGDWLKEHGWRVTTINPSDYHAMKHYVLPLRYHDLLGVSKGGFLVGTYGMEKHLRPFASAFRALPAVVFEDVAGGTEFVKVRSKVYGGRRWFYVVNTHHEPAAMSLNVTAPVTDLVSGETREAGTLRLELKPYELRSFSLPVNGAVSIR